MRRTARATVITVVVAMGFTVAHAASLPLRPGSLLVLRQAVAIEIPEPPEPPTTVLVEGFGPPTTGQPLAPPWSTPAGDLRWTAEGGIGKADGQNPGDNLAVIDAGVATDITVEVTISALADGPGGGPATQVGLVVRADATGTGIRVLYERRSGLLRASSATGELGTADIGSGRDALSPLRVTLRDDPPSGVPPLVASVDDQDVLTLSTLPPATGDATHHGISVNRDRDAVFTDFRIEAQP